ncbi:MAG: hypothetical protein ACYC4I_03065 [Minisyncoccota bacterium]
MKRFFPRKAKSFADFAKIIKEEGGTKVAISPYADVQGGSRFTLVGTIGNFKYVLEFTSVLRSGRKVIYRESVFDRFGSTGGLADAKERRDSFVRLYLLAEKRTLELRGKLSETVTVDLLGPDDLPMDEAGYRRLHRDAESVHVSV